MGLLTFNGVYEMCQEQYKHDFGLGEAVANTTEWFMEHTGPYHDHHVLKYSLGENMGWCPVIASHGLNGPVPGFEPNGHTIDLTFANGNRFTGRAGLLDGTATAVIGSFGDKTPEVLILHCTEYERMLAMGLLD